MTAPALALPVDDIASVAAPPVALYIHIPFCVSLCPYCEFVVYPGAAARGTRSRVRTFVEALLTEIELRGRQAAERWPERAPLASVYLGGGTPSLLPPEDLASILQRVRDSYGVTPDAEITLEANPGRNERGDLRAAVRAGVSRVSFGAQSFDPGELRRLGRRHSPGDVAAALDAAREAGMRSLNLDLLYDVPAQSEASWAASLEAALEAAPDHLSLYSLTLGDPGAEGLTGANGDHLPTPVGAQRWRARARREQDDDRAAAQYRHATDRLAAVGWHGYEISNWARPGHESRHNRVYWRRLPYDAVGPGAHAFDGAERRWNAARLDGYVAALGVGKLPPGGVEPIDAPTAATEEAMLGLRTDDGLPLSALNQPQVRAAIAWATEYGLATRDADQRIRLTTDGRLLSNEIFARLV